MKEKIKKICLHFGCDHQELKAKEEWLELQIALMELAKFDIKHKLGEFEKDIILDIALTRLELINRCNEELADNILLRMQLQDRDFEETWYLETHYRYPNDLLREYHLYDFKFDKEVVRKTVEEKIDRTIRRYFIEV